MLPVAISRVNGDNGAAGAESLPGGPGAYGLIVRVARPLRPAIPALGGVLLPVGRYLYAGSANGPGGIRARVRRHLGAAKALRWHVDVLTDAFGVELVIVLPGGAECSLVEAVRAWPEVTVPAPGFGSSDCRRCPAHLLRLPDGATLADLTAPRWLAAIAEASGAARALAWRPPE